MNVILIMSLPDHAYIPAIISDGMFSSEKYIELDHLDGQVCVAVNTSDVKNGTVKVRVIDQDGDIVQIQIMGYPMGEYPIVNIPSSMLDIGAVFAS